MVATKENPRAVFRKFPRRDLERFKVNERAASASVADFLARSRITPAEVAWLDRQPVYGTPSLPRLRAKLVERGFVGIRLEVIADGLDLDVQVRLTAQVDVDDTESLLRLLITQFRSAGFRVGFSEMSIVNVDGPVISCHTATGPMEELVAQGPPAIELEHGR
jgi:hypothetical protein